ncbi:hypothetical protein E6O75_ATG02272 [Venturia nashicola]|uniref:Uncharacterized protein n=1 Tax=Venturia nashicola TaxID=86259 RepID=A0A4Z1P652_9PEZI|nr:hypothetical protein E6O75_ATG02272 [Venturia nashicola]
MLRVERRGQGSPPKGTLPREPSQGTPPKGTLPGNVPCPPPILQLIIHLALEETAGVSATSTAVPHGLAQSTRPSPAHLISCAANMP